MPKYKPTDQDVWEVKYCPVCGQQVLGEEETCDWMCDQQYKVYQEDCEWFMMKGLGEE